MPDYSVSHYDVDDHTPGLPPSFNGSLGTSMHPGWCFGNLDGADHSDDDAGGPVFAGGYSHSDHQNNKEHSSPDPVQLFDQTARFHPANGLVAGHVSTIQTVGPDSATYSPPDHGTDLDEGETLAVPGMDSPSEPPKHIHGLTEQVAGKALAKTKDSWDRIEAQYIAGSGPSLERDTYGFLPIGRLVWKHRGTASRSDGPYFMLHLRTIEAAFISKAGSVNQLRPVQFAPQVSNKKQHGTIK
ncbi:hypothetical protein LTR17_019188 [Elasticomyces elasticus]|nr:hypothetical protein LTR17_019188 [Elasticomyces elasticus]